MAEATMRMQLPEGQETGTGVLVRIEPEKLPVSRESIQEPESTGFCSSRGILLRHGAVELEMPEGMAMSRIAELVKALNNV